MEEGSMRCDVNVSVHKPGTPFGTRCEIKNVNSIRAVGRAIDYEARRQIDIISSGGTIKQQTLHWDDAAGRTNVLRTKEDADDYRYFLEPDLVPLVPDAAWVERVRAALPPLPAARRASLATLTGQSKESEAVAVVVERGQDAYVAEVAKVGGDAARALVYVQQGFAQEPAAPRVPAGDLAALTLLEKNAKITATQAKTLLADLVAAGGGDVIAMAKSKGFEAMDSGALEALVDAAIAADPDAWAKFKAGEQKAMGALVGAVMKSSKGKADGKAVSALLAAKAVK
jgi:aspartyl-tRNA(Asn)/glutamyl-tRNA(Gln) amidotransferase subunit B